MRTNQKLIWLLVIIIIIGLGYYFFTRTNKYSLSDWKIYKNTDYGFSFQYPKDFVLNEQSQILKERKCFDEVSFANCVSPSKVGYLLNLQSDSYSIKIEVRYKNFFSENSGTGGAPSEITKSSALNVDGIIINKIEKNNLQTSENNNKYIDYLFSTKDADYTFHFEPIGNFSDTISDQIIKTFGFTN